MNNITPSQAIEILIQLAQRADVKAGDSFAVAQAFQLVGELHAQLKAQEPKQEPDKEVEASDAE